MKMSKNKRQFLSVLSRILFNLTRLLFSAVIKNVRFFGNCLSPATKRTVSYMQRKWWGTKSAYLSVVLLSQNRESVTFKGNDWGKGQHISQLCNSQRTENHKLLKEMVGGRSAYLSVVLFSQNRVSNFQRKYWGEKISISLSCAALM